MKIKDGFILKKVMGSYMIVCIDDSMSISGMQTLNETGAFLWDALSESTTEDALLKKMLAEYDVDETTAKNDITAFVAALKKSNLLED
ncbi:MAG: PqqD family protein [Clostridia bacterium]|nr:PqqD family protein [Clostridia bacterium]